MGAISENGQIEVLPPTDVSPADILNTSPELYEPYVNNTALVVGRDDTIIDSIKTFIGGTPLEVTYYHQISSNASTSSLTSAPSLFSDSVNTSFLKIMKMELLLDESLVHTFQEDTVTSSVTGMAHVYPGFTPKIGDLFTFMVSSGNMGLFKVSNNPTRLTIHNTTSHQIKFSLFKILTTDDNIAIEERVRDVAYFDKQRFLNEDGALLTHQEVKDQERITKSIEQMITEYHDLFYRRSYRSIMLDETIYDPYLVEFCVSTLGPYIRNNFIQVYHQKDMLPHYNRSLYATLYGTNPTPETIVNTGTDIEITTTSYSTLVSALFGCMLRTLDPDSETLYIPSSAISLDTVNDAFDAMIQSFLAENVLYVVYLNEELENWRDYTLEQKFYRLPILIFLCQLVQYKLNTGISYRISFEDITENIST